MRTRYNTILTECSQASEELNPSINYINVLKYALEQGYTHIIRWVNSDDNWAAFCKSENEAIEAKIDWYMEENPKYSREESAKYCQDMIDVISIDEEITNA